MAARKEREIGFIGGGNMAEALIRGLLESGRDPSALLVAEPLAARRRALARRYKVGVTARNEDVAASSAMVVLAVKPQVMDDVLGGLKGLVTKTQLVVSIAAGVRLARIEEGLGAEVRVVRVMPNTPSLVGRGMAALCGGAQARPVDLRRARAVFSTVGEALVLGEEALLDPVTGLSGSGPAYVYLFAEALIRGGVAAGLEEEVARTLAYRTIGGAAEMLLQTGESPEALRQAVSSPGGTTVAGLARLDKGRFVEVVGDAVETATRRSVELGKG